MGRAFASAEAQFIELYDNCCLPRFNRRWRIITSSPSADISTRRLWWRSWTKQPHFGPHPSPPTFSSMSLGPWSSHIIHLFDPLLTYKPEKLSKKTQVDPRIENVVQIDKVLLDTPGPCSHA